MPVDKLSLFVLLVGDRIKALSLDNNTSPVFLLIFSLE